MIDHISLQRMDTLVLKEETPEKALAILQALEKATKRGQLEKWPTNYVISLSNSKIIISGEIRFALTVFCKFRPDLLSEKRGVELVHEIAKLRDTEKKSQKIAAAKGIYAKRQLNQPYPTAASLNSRPAYEPSPKFKAIMEELEKLRAEEVSFGLRKK